METEQFFLDLPAFADVLGSWLQSKSGQWRPNVLKFSLNLLGDLQPRAITRDLDWGVPIPLDGWRDLTDKRIYVWFDAVIGYLSASIEWAQAVRRPGRVARLVAVAGRRVLLLHGQGQHRLPRRDLARHAARLQRARAPAAASPARSASSTCRPRWCPASTSRWRAGSSPRPARSSSTSATSWLATTSTRCATTSRWPDRRTQDTDFTWSEFVRRNNDELVANWGNLVNRSISFAARNIGEIPAAGQLTEADRALLDRSAAAFATVGDALARCRFKAAITEAMRTLAEANKYLSDQAPWKLRETDPERMRTICHVALQLVDDGKTLLTPFLPRSSQQVFEMLGGVRPVVGHAADRGGQRGWRTALPGDHRGLRDRRALGVGADQARHAAQPARAAVRQAGPLGRRRGTGQAGAQVTDRRGPRPTASGQATASGDRRRRLPSRCRGRRSTATATST